MKFICVKDTRHWWQQFLHPANWPEVGVEIGKALVRAKDTKGEPGVLLKDMDVKIVEIDI